MLLVGRRFNIKTGRNVDEANSKKFQFNFASFAVIVTGKLFYLR